MLLFKYSELLACIYKDPEVVSNAVFDPKTKEFCALDMTSAFDVPTEIPFDDSNIFAFDVDKDAVLFVIERLPYEFCMLTLLPVFSTIPDEVKQIEDNVLERQTFEFPYTKKLLDI